MKTVCSVTLGCYCVDPKGGHHEKCDLSVQGLRRARKLWRSKGWDRGTIRSFFESFKRNARELEA